MSHLDLFDILIQKINVPQNTTYEAVCPLGKEKPQAIAPTGLEMAVIFFKTSTTSKVTRLTLTNQAVNL
ncbi:MAG: hypothetical protein AAB550_03390 [Patescibacteria group bacterium]